VAVWAHIGGFVAGMVLIKLFENRTYTAQRTGWRHRLHPDHP
jgi:membrane associated rhomboid family serine protease